MIMQSTDDEKCHVDKLKELLSKTQSELSARKPSAESIRQALKVSLSNPKLFVVTDSEESFKLSLIPIIDRYVQEMVAKVSHAAVDSNGTLCYVEPEFIMKESIVILNNMVRNLSINLSFH